MDNEGGTSMEWMLMPLRRYAEFSGRSRRKEFWMFALGVMLVYMACGLLMLGGGLASSFQTAGTVPPAFTPVFWLGAGLLGIVALGLLVPSVAVTVRRLHDRDMSGWWYPGFVLIGLIPYVGFLGNIAFLVLMCLPGTPGPNRFGTDPKNPPSYEAFA